MPRSAYNLYVAGIEPGSEMVRSTTTMKKIALLPRKANFAYAYEAIAVLMIEKNAGPSVSHKEFQNMPRKRTPFTSRSVKIIS